MTDPRGSEVLGRITLLTGKEEFLSERAVAAVRAAIRQLDPEAEFAERSAEDLTPAVLADLAAPTLFSSTRCVVVRELENITDEGAAGLLEYAAAPADDVAVVVVHRGGQRGSGTLSRLRKLPGVDETRAAEYKAFELPRFVDAEVRAVGSSIDQEAARFLVQAVGPDLRSLAAAAAQLTSDFPAEPLSLDLVRRYFGGRAAVKSFAVADAAFSGRRSVALEELRWALEIRVEPVLVTSALAGSARAIARYLGAPRRMREADLAREVGVPPWKLRLIRDQARGWSETSLAGAIRAVAKADADIKGAGSNPAYTLENLVLTVTGLRSGG